MCAATQRQPLLLPNHQHHAPARIRRYVFSLRDPGQDFWHTQTLTLSLHPPLTKSFNGVSSNECDDLDSGCKRWTRVQIIQDDKSKPGNMSSSCTCRRHDNWSAETRIKRQSLRCTDKVPHSTREQEGTHLQPMYFVTVFVSMQDGPLPPYIPQAASFGNPEERGDEDRRQTPPISSAT